ncbi:hypothetical protein GOP47_0000800 [Adiantum capillus-veneris]|uniref:Uncharacterized protein n=1 Tax=Adiantum capillus-veneris TaxID=13818 RepID=A0A9D4VDN9_ADICA|nr:hypothetical protein GOP47_0000800 [Adiantum capillus-veneris]
MQDHSIIVAASSSSITVAIGVYIVEFAAFACCSSLFMALGQDGSASGLTCLHRALALRSLYLSSLLNTQLGSKLIVENGCTRAPQSEGEEEEKNQA